MWFGGGCDKLSPSPCIVLRRRMRWDGGKCVEAATEILRNENKRSLSIVMERKVENVKTYESSWCWIENLLCYATHTFYRLIPKKSSARERKARSRQVFDIFFDLFVMSEEKWWEGDDNDDDEFYANIIKISQTFKNRKDDWFVNKFGRQQKKALLTSLSCRLSSSTFCWELFCFFYCSTRVELRAFRYLNEI